ncbi:MAG: hypothetical protein IPK57_12165 [Chitinophagaceae bacterium]|nr:hypothetical protein [Chitinophagaceae bacterium]
MLKMVKYAMLNGRNIISREKASLVQTPLISWFYIFNYSILKLGFLDGHAGYICARMTAYYTFLKYARLKELNKGDENR